MNLTFLLLPGISLIILFTVSLHSFTAESQTERQSRVIAVAILSFMAIVVLMTNESDLIIYKLGFFLGFSIGLPSLIAFFVNQNKITHPVSHSKTNFWDIIIFVLVLIFLLFQFLILGEFSLAEKLVFIFIYHTPIVLTFILILIKKTIFHKNGIFHYGMLWSWGDFKEYEWENKKSHHNEKLILKTKFPLLNGKITLNIAPKEKKVIDELLSTNLLSSS